MKSTFRLGRIRGIEVGVHWSLLVIALLIVGSLSGSLLPSVAPDAHGSYLAAGIIGAVLFLASILAHELAHALVAQRNGQEVDGITLWLLGGVARLKNEAPSAKAELKVAAVGPATSLALGGAFIGLAFTLDTFLSSGSLLPVVAWWLGMVNIVLAVFNLLPGAPLDGGRILSAIVWAWRKDRRRAQIVAARVGRGLGVIVMGLAGVMIATGYPDALWTGLVGWFLLSASAAEEQAAKTARALDGRAASDVMLPIAEIPALPEWTLAADAAEHVAPDSGGLALLTGFGGSPSGVVPLAALARVPAAARGRVRASQLGVRLSELRRVKPSTPALAALIGGFPVAVVDDDGTLLGVIGPEQLGDVAGDRRRVASR